MFYTKQACIHELREFILNACDVMLAFFTDLASTNNPIIQYFEHKDLKNNNLSRFTFWVRTLMVLLSSLIYRW